MSEKEKFRKFLRPYIMFTFVLCILGGFVFIQWFYSVKIKPNIDIVQPNNDTLEKTDSRVTKIDSNVVDSNNTINCSPLDSLLKEKQKLQDSLLMEVTGRSSGKEGYGPKAKAIQKLLEETENKIEQLQNYSAKKDVDTIKKSDNDER
jgi:hypothetical protein